jgi:hypothetical protein
MAEFLERSDDLFVNPTGSTICTTRTGASVTQDHGENGLG